MFEELTGYLLLLSVVIVTVVVLTYWAMAYKRRVQQLSRDVEGNKARIEEVTKELEKARTESQEGTEFPQLPNEDLPAPPVLSLSQKIEDYVRPLIESETEETRAPILLCAKASDMNREAAENLREELEGQRRKVLAMAKALGKEDPTVKREAKKLQDGQELLEERLSKARKYEHMSKQAAEGRADLRMLPILKNVNDERLKGMTEIVEVEAEIKNQEKTLEAFEKQLREPKEQPPVEQFLSELLDEDEGEEGSQGGGL